MSENDTIVIDIGKTNAKMSLWRADGNLVARRSRANEVLNSPHYQTLDVHGIYHWLIASLTEFASLGKVKQIVPVGHGAAAVLLRDGDLYAPPMDYEQVISTAIQESYANQRDPFSATGSPALPGGLNLGLQLHYIEHVFGPLHKDVTVLPWPQYWAWRLCGEMASDVSSLGCHSDLWRHRESRFSDLAQHRGWSTHLAPVRFSEERLGSITDEVSRITGISPECTVLCGVHDSNAALLAARGHPEIDENDATILSTGTWFVAMRALAAGVEFDTNELAEARDCLVNVDVFGCPVPSARFMGGREAELIEKSCSFRLADHFQPGALLDRLSALVESGCCMMPSLVQGTGPYPNDSGYWYRKPVDSIGQRVALSMYLALMSHSMLNLIGSCDRLLIDGRFAQDIIFTRTLAALRPHQRMYVSNAEHDVAYGALRLVNPDLLPIGKLAKVQPLRLDLKAYAHDWQARIQDNKAIV